jgi:protein tyrosine phosphatase (PTP) superfamily phosphohydrolase (DUF442 family)
VTRERGPWGPLRWFGLILALVIVTFLWQLRAWLVTGNLHSVVDEQVYRSGQLSAEQLTELSELHGLRSIVNLRGDQHELTWYAAERLVATERNLDFHSLRLSGDRLPSPDNLARLLDMLDEAERPTLIHCLNGTDRSGLASALTLLLAGADLETARREFSIEHGYLALVSPSDLRQLLDLYQAWLASENTPHSPEQLHRFAREGYTPYFYAADIEALGVPAAVQTESPLTLAFRITNTSPGAWPLTPYPEQGVHLALSVSPVDGEASDIRWYRGKTPNKALAPGQSLEVPVELPAFRAAGRYRVYVDMVDEWVAKFADMGSVPLEFEIDVSEARLAR